MAKHGEEISSDTKQNIIKLIESGWRVRDIAKSLNLCESTVSRIIKRWRDRGNVENKSRPGRPKFIKKRSERALSRIVKVNRRSTLKEITSELNTVTPVKMSTRTVQRRLHFLGYKRRSVRKVIGTREVNKKKRLAWCRGKIHWTVENNWKNIMFTDEMMIHIKPDGKTKVWRKASEKWRPECLGYVANGPTSPLKLMVWGCITYHGVGKPVFVDGNMNSEKYISILDNNLWEVVVKHYGDKSWIYQDDNLLPVTSQDNLKIGNIGTKFHN